MAPPKVQKFSPPPRGGGEGKEKTTQTASLTLYRYSPFSGTKNGVHLSNPVEPVAGKGEGRMPSAASHDSDWAFGN